MYIFEHSLPAHEHLGLIESLYSRLHHQGLAEYPVVDVEGENLDLVAEFFAPCVYRICPREILSNFVQFDGVFLPKHRSGRAFNDLEYQIIDGVQLNARFLEVVTIEPQLLIAVTGGRKGDREACIALPVERRQRSWYFRSRLRTRWRGKH